MDSIELFPSLSHCIEDTARKKFWNLTNQYMEGGHKDKKLEQRIELLKNFLESMNFKKLRSQSERYLVDGRKIKFVISWRDGKANYEIVVIKATD